MHLNKFKKNFKKKLKILKKKLKELSGVGTGNSHTYPIPFNFFNETRIRIILNKWGEVGIGMTCPYFTPLSSLCNAWVDIFIKLK